MVIKRYDLNPRPYPRTLQRAGFEMDADHSDSVQEMADFHADDLIDPDPTAFRSGLSRLTRYTIDRTSKAFRRGEQGVRVEEQQTVDALTGVIFGVSKYREYRKLLGYNPARDPSENPVLCSSPDGVTGYGDNGEEGEEHNCMRCPLAQWPSKEDQDWFRKNDRAAEARPRCNDRYRVFLKDQESVRPSFIDVPGTMNKDIQRYAERLSGLGVRDWQVVSVMSVGTNERGHGSLSFDFDGYIDCNNVDVVESVNHAKAEVAELAYDHSVRAVNANGNWQNSYAADDSDSKVVEGTVVETRTPLALMPDGTPIYDYDELRKLQQEHPTPGQDPEPEVAPEPPQAPQASRPNNAVSAAAALRERRERQAQAGEL